MGFLCNVDVVSFHTYITLLHGSYLGFTRDDFFRDAIFGVGGDMKSSSFVSEEE